MNLKVSIEKGENGYFVATVPPLKGCRSQGTTRGEALTYMRVAINLISNPTKSKRRTASAEFSTNE